MARKNTSTLDPWIAGRRVHGRVVSVVLGASKKRVTRDVLYQDGGQKRVGVRELQDHLLVEKGYLPKYSYLPPSHFAKSRMPKKGTRKRR